MSKKKVAITAFEQYLERNCKGLGLNLEIVNDYAEKGQSFLRAVMQGDKGGLPSRSVSNNLAYLHWYLLKKSFDENRPFSKGMFNLEGEDDAATERLYRYLKGDAFSKKESLTLQLIKGLPRGSKENYDKSYARASTHYNDYFADKDERSFGIDKTAIPLAWKFRTHTFGLIKNEDNSLSLFIKPETRSMDVKKTVEAIKHGGNLVQKVIKPEKIKGMGETFREDSLPSDVKNFVKKNLLGEASSKKNMKEIDSCENIPALKKLLNAIQSTLNINDYLLSHYGTTNQIGSEQRFRVSGDGELIAMKKNDLLESQALSDSTNQSPNMITLDSDFEEEPYRFTKGLSHKFEPNPSPLVSQHSELAEGRAKDVKNYFKEQLKEMRQGAGPSEEIPLDDAKNVSVNKP